MRLCLAGECVLKQKNASLPRADRYLQVRKDRLATIRIVQITERREQALTTGGHLHQASRCQVCERIFVRVEFLIPDIVQQFGWLTVFGWQADNA